MFTFRVKENQLEYSYKPECTETQFCLHNLVLRSKLAKSYVLVQARLRRCQTRYEVMGGGGGGCEGEVSHTLSNVVIASNIYIPRSRLIRHLQIWSRDNVYINKNHLMWCTRQFFLLAFHSPGDEYFNVCRNMIAKAIRQHTLKHSHDQWSLCLHLTLRALSLYKVSQRPLTN
jgi:hypothetical protein